MTVSAKAKPTGCDREALSLPARNKTGLSTGAGNFDRRSQDIVSAALMAAPR
jgi:hypothetical protein